MFWFKGKEPENFTKEKQIKELTTSFPSIRRPNQDDNLFEVVFEIDRKYNTLRIYLPSDFPANKPVLQVLGPVVHPWLDQYKRVSGCDKLTYWSKATSLTEVVQETLSQLRNGTILSTNPPIPQQPPQLPQANVQTNPFGPPTSYFPPQTATMNQPLSNPLPKNSTPLGLNDIRPISLASQPPPQQQQHQHYSASSNIYSPTSQAHTRGESTRYSAAPEPVVDMQSNNNRRPVSREKLHIPLPAVPNSFPEISQLSVAQLQKLYNDEAALNAHIAKLDCVESLRTMRDQIRQSNTQEANENLSQEGDLRQLEAELKSLQNTLRKLKNEYQGKLAQMEARYATSKPALIDKFNENKDNLDESSERIANDFVSGGTDLQIFIQAYLPMRSNYHRMRIQATHAS